MEKKPEEKSTSEIAKASKAAIGYNRKVVNVHHHSPKAHTYDAEMVKQMTSRFNALVYTMGFEDPVEDDTMQVLMLWIQEQFGDLSMVEMIDAFQMAAAFKLDGAPKHYKNFDMQYIGGVLNAYKSYRTKQLKIFKLEEAARMASENPLKRVSDKEMYQVMLNIAMERGEVSRVGDWSSAYNYAWQERLVHRMNKRERESYKKIVISSLTSESKRVSRERSKSIGELIGTPRKLQSECHKRILHDHFRAIIKKNAKVEED